MALSASAVPRLRCQIKYFEGQQYPVYRCSQFLHVCNHQTFRTCSIRAATMAQFNEPSRVKEHMSSFRERLWAALPSSVKEFPLKKAEDLMQQQMLLLGERVLKWSLITVLVFSSLSDVIFSIVRNRELMIPLGIFVGCTMAEFLKETSQELFQSTKEGGLSWHLLGIGSFFLLVKFISVYLTVQGRAFFSHVGNGGLMQVLWLWKKLQEERENGNGKESTLHQDASMANNVQN